MPLTAAAARAGRTAGAVALQHIQAREDDRVLYNSFNGHFSDSPRAIFEELARRDGSRRHVWIATDRARNLPGGVRRVPPYSWPYLREVGRARHIVSNLQMPNNFLKPKGVSYLQTWHGTPLKRIGLDIPRWNHQPAALKRTLRDYNRWDYLITQNSYSTEIFRRAFGFDGEILETGYPRNDALSAVDRDEVRARVRAELGIEDGITAVLYAPTWRDNLVDPEGRLEFSLALDLDVLSEALGPDHVFLLRLHYLIAAKLADAFARGVKNVSAWSDIRELYLAADVLVTDYSSAMFDFAVTGKPMVFFTYDMDDYRDEVRGFYFDLEQEAPGPLCTTTGEVADALAALPEVAAASTGRYERFRQRFCPHDDGHAAARVVDRVFAA